LQQAAHHYASAREHENLHGLSGAKYRPLLNNHEADNRTTSLMVVKIINARTNERPIHMPHFWAFAETGRPRPASIA
jgi:hypothetical protein